MAMCRGCGHRYAQDRTGLCRSCLRAFEATRRVETAVRSMMIEDANDLRRPPRPRPRPLRTIVVEGRAYDVMWDGTVRDVEAAS